MESNRENSDESNVDLENEKLPTTKTTSISSYLKTEINLKHSDLPIIACCLVSGFCDSGVYSSWQCFVSMQTGTLHHILLSYLP